jgi:hypothetical protein
LVNGKARHEPRKYELVLLTACCVTNFMREKEREKKRERRRRKIRRRRGRGRGRGEGGRG